MSHFWLSTYWHFSALWLIVSFCVNHSPQRHLWWGLTESMSRERWTQKAIWCCFTPQNSSGSSLKPVSFLTMGSCFIVSRCFLPQTRTFPPLLHSWAHLATLVIITVHSVHSWRRLLIDFFFSLVAFQTPSSMRTSREEDLASQYPCDLSIPCDQYVCCFQLFNLLIL